MKTRALILLIALAVMPLTWRIFSLPWWMLLVILVSLVAVIKFPKSIWVVVPILFLFDLGVNNLLDLSLRPLTFSFDWEKIVISNPAYLKLIERYWQEDLWLPFRLRNIFYSSWLLIFSWLDLLFKLWSPTFLVQVLGYSGSGLFILGLWEYFNNKNRKIWPLIWWLTVTVTSALGMLVDSKSALVLALPSLVYFIYRGADNKYFKKWWILWLVLIVIDIILR